VEVIAMSAICIVTLLIVLGHAIGDVWQWKETQKNSSRISKLEYEIKQLHVKARQTQETKEAEKAGCGNSGRGTQSAAQATGGIEE
jgi:hypothetical protein